MPYVEMGRIISDFVEGVEVTVVESPGGAGENVERIMSGEYDLGMDTTVTFYEAYHGKGRFEGRGEHEEARNILNLVELIFGNTVRQDSGIKSIEELDGVPYFPGPPGSLTATSFMEAAEVIGIEPKLYSGVQSDAVAALKDNRIKGMCSAFVGVQPSAGVIEVQQFTPLWFIGYTKEQIQEFIEEYPIHAMKKTNPDDIPGFERFPGQSEEVYSILTVTSLAATSRMSEEVVYEITKAIWENRERVEAVFSAFKDMTLEDSLIFSVPLHAGAVRYYREGGLDVPEHLIPPEYQR